MSVQTASGRYSWHKEWHDQEMSDPAFKSLTYLERGVYKTLRNLCGQTNNEGTLRTNAQTGQPMTYREIIAWAAAEAPGCTRAEVKKAIDRLLDPNVGLLSRRRNDVIVVTRWVEEQTKPASPAADRQRRSRALRAVGGGFPPPPPPHASASGAPDGSRPECDMSHRGNVTCHTEHESSELRAEEGAYAPHESHERISGSDSDRFAQSGGGGGGKEALYTMDPVKAACWLTAEYSTFPVNVYRKALRNLEEKFGPVDGLAMFRDCLVELWHAIKENRVRTTRSALFQAIIRGKLAGGPG